MITTPIHHPIKNKPSTTCGGRQEIFQILKFSLVEYQIRTWHCCQISTKLHIACCAGALTSTLSMRQQLPITSGWVDLAIGAQKRPMDFNVLRRSRHLFSLVAGLVGTDQELTSPRSCTGAMPVTSWHSQSIHVSIYLAI